MSEALLPGTSILRVEDGARYELGNLGNWFPMEYHCGECMDDGIVYGADVGEFSLLTVPVAVLEAAKAECCAVPQREPGEPDLSNAPGVLLRASSLASRWGFGDGDVLDEWHEEVFDCPAPDGMNLHKALAELVLAHLVPLLESKGYVIDTEYVGGIHNPIVARYVNGEKIDDQAAYSGALGELIIIVPAEVAWASMKATS